MRSPRAEMEPWAQHEPQYCGMCWLRLMVSRFLSPQEKASGSSCDLSVSCGSGETVWLPRHTRPAASVFFWSQTSDMRPDLGCSTIGVESARAAVIVV